MEGIIWERESVWFDSSDLQAAMELTSRNNLVFCDGVKWAVVGPRLTEMMSRRRLEVTRKLQVREPIVNVRPSGVDSWHIERKPYWIGFGRK